MVCPDKTLSDNIKTCIITGATTGIGKALAINLSAYNFRLILIARNTLKGNTLANKINKTLGKDNATFIKADIANLAEVRDAATQIKNLYPRVDILINNAGVRFNDRKQNNKGIELTFATNHLGHFLLTQLLLDAIRNASCARIINVASDAHYGYSADFDYVLTKNNYDRKAAYGRSKLANLLFTYELARRLAGTSVTVNAVHPGGVATNLGRNNGIISWLRHYMYYVMKGQLITSAKAAESIAYLALSDEVKGITGRYFFNKKQIRSSDISYDKNAAKKLWDLSLQLIGEKLGNWCVARTSTAIIKS